MPLQKELNRLYATASNYVLSCGAREAYQRKRKKDGFREYVLRHVLESFRCGCSGSNVLEVGAGGGHLLEQFRALGYQCYGVDPAQWVRDTSILPDLDQLPRNARFDLFVLQDVLEHLHDPLEMMKKLQEVATKGARLFCSFPCKDSKPAKIKKDKWAMILPFGHLHYFSRKSTMEMLSAAGWKIVEMRIEYATKPLDMLLSLNIKDLAYTILKSGRDQLYVSARS